MSEEEIKYSNGVPENFMEFRNKLDSVSKIMRAIGVLVLDTAVIPTTEDEFGYEDPEHAYKDDIVTAYYSGERDGRVNLSRQILKMLREVE